MARSPSVFQSEFASFTAGTSALGVIDRDSGQPLYRVDAPGFPTGEEFGQTLIDLLAGNVRRFLPPVVSLSRNSLNPNDEIGRASLGFS